DLATDHPRRSAAHRFRDPGCAGRARASAPHAIDAATIDDATHAWFLREPRNLRRRATFRYRSGVGIVRAIRWARFWTGGVRAADGIWLDTHAVSAPSSSRRLV